MFEKKFYIQKSSTKRPNTSKHFLKSLINYAARIYKPHAPTALCTLSLQICLFPRTKKNTRKIYVQRKQEIKKQATKLHICWTLFQMRLTVGP